MVFLGHIGTIPEITCPIWESGGPNTDPDIVV